MESTRRTFLARSAGALGLLFLESLTPELIAQAHKHAASSAAADGAGFHFLSKQEAADFEAFASQIVPSDGTPGAREAGAVYFVDYILSTINQEQQQDFRQAMAMLRAVASEAQPGASFAALPSDKQIAVMKKMENGAGGGSWLPVANTGPAGQGKTEAAKRAEAFGNLRSMVVLGTFCDPSLHGNRSKIGWKLIGFDDQDYWAPPFGYYDAKVEGKA